MRTICLSCQSVLTVRNGRIHTGKQNRKCKACGRQFVEDPEKVFIPREKWELVEICPSDPAGRGYPQKKGA